MRGYVYVYLKLSHTLVSCWLGRVVTKLLRAVLPGEEMYPKTTKQEEEEDKQDQSEDKRAPALQHVQDHSTHAREETDDPEGAERSDKQ